MSKNPNIKRLNLHFNLENEVENKMWSYLSAVRKKPDEVKRLIELAMQGKDINPIELNSIEEKIEPPTVGKEDLEQLKNSGIML